MLLPVHLISQFEEIVMEKADLHQSCHFNNLYTFCMGKKSLQHKFYAIVCFHFVFLNSQLTMNDFSVHRIIGRGGFGEVYGCRKADTGKM